MVQQILPLSLFHKESTLFPDLPLQIIMPQVPLSLVPLHLRVPILSTAGTRNPELLTRSQATLLSRPSWHLPAIPMLMQNGHLPQTKSSTPVGLHKLRLSQPLRSQDIPVAGQKPVQELHPSRGHPVPNLPQLRITHFMVYVRL